jgi:hypothetical protein
MVQCKEPKGHAVDMLNTQKQEMETVIREYNSNVSTLQSLQNNGGSETDIQFHQDKILELLNKAEDINSQYVDKISNLNSQIRNRNSDTNTMSHDVKTYQENIDKGHLLKSQMEEKVHNSKSKKDSLAFTYILYLGTIILFIVIQILLFIFLQESD